MQVQCNLKYNSSTNHTSDSKNGGTRYRKAQKIVTVEVDKIPVSKARLAFCVKAVPTEHVSQPYYWYNGSFWKRQIIIEYPFCYYPDPNDSRWFEKEENIREVLSREYSRTQARFLRGFQEEFQGLQDYAKRYMIIGQYVCVRTDEPYYELICYDDSISFIVYDDKPTKKSMLNRCFDAMHFDEMKEEALKIAEKGHIQLNKSFSDLSKIGRIEVIDERFVTTILHSRFWIKDEFFQSLANLRSILESGDISSPEKECSIRYIDKLCEIIGKYQDSLLV